MHRGGWVCVPIGWISSLSCNWIEDIDRMYTRIGWRMQALLKRVGEHYWNGCWGAGVLCGVLLQTFGKHIVEACCGRMLLVQNVLGKIEEY